MEDQGQCIITTEEVLATPSESFGEGMRRILKDRGAPIVDGDFDPAYLVEQLRCNDTGGTIFRWRKI